MHIRERIARLWHYRELLVAMVRTELKVRYKNSALGFAWSLVNPLLYLVVFYIAFDLILGAGIPAFPLFLLSGLLVWNLFSAGLGAATGSVVGNAGLIKKVSFPREILPLASIGAALVHFFLQSAVLAAAFLVTRWNVAWAYIPLLPLALISLLLLTAGLGILLGSINVYLRDTQHFLELALLAWFWMTPIVYGFMTIGRRGGWGEKVYMLNPVTPVVIAVPACALREDRDGRTGGKLGRRAEERGRNPDPSRLVVDALSRLSRLHRRRGDRAVHLRPLRVRPAGSKLRRGAVGR